jgi:hypothetical protein
MILADAPFSTFFRHASEALHTLVFAITSLDFFMYPLLHLSFKNASPGWLVVLGDFENVCSVDPIVGSPPHDMIAIAIVFIHRHLVVVSYALGVDVAVE